MLTYPALRTGAPEQGSDASAKSRLVALHEETQESGVAAQHKETPEGAVAAEQEETQESGALGEEEATQELCNVATAAAEGERAGGVVPVGHKSHLSQVECT